MGEKNYQNIISIGYLYIIILGILYTLSLTKTLDTPHRVN